MIYDVLIVGAGVVGCAVARELARRDGAVCVLEKGEDVCTGTSKANSAIVHGGFDALPGTKKAEMNVRGNAMMTQIAEELDVPFKRNGAFVLCFDEADLPALHALYARGVENGVEKLQILSAAEARRLEPALNESFVAALHCPTSGIVCPFELTLGLAENAADNGVSFFFNREVLSIAAENGLYTVKTADEAYTARAVLNAAGVFADKIHDMALPHAYSVLPRAGEYCLCDKTVGTLVSHTIFQMPGKLGKGVLVTPTVHGNLLLGPTASDTPDRENTATTQSGLDFVLDKAARSISAVPARAVITSFSGLRAHTDSQTDDFILEESAPGFFEAAGIESPGLSSAPAIGVYMAEKISAALSLSMKANFNPIRRGVPSIAALPDDARAEKIRENPAYGSIVCRCETVSEGEIVDSIRRTLGATTLDGVKRRTRAGMGRCQAGFCSPRVMDILARELNLPLTAIRKGGADAALVFGKTK